MYPIEAFLQHTPRVKLMPAPTPLHPLHTPAPREDVSLWIKRDDMTGIGPGGNKIRSLEFILGEALEAGATKILASGPVQSNLCALTAAACARVDLPCELVINGDEPAHKEGNLLLAQLLGTKLHFLGPCDGDTRNRHMEELLNKYQSEGERPFAVRNGATTGRGALGYTSAVGNPFQLVIVSVEDDRSTLERHIRETIREAEKITGIPMEEPASGVWEITDAYRGDGWGQNTRESVQEVLDFPRREGIFIENVYNSKVLVGMKDWVASGRVTGPVCYLHTGGLGSLFAQY